MGAWSELDRTFQRLVELAWVGVIAVLNAVLFTVLGLFTSEILLVLFLVGCGIYVLAVVLAWRRFRSGSNTGGTAPSFVAVFRMVTSGVFRNLHQYVKDLWARLK